jgi:hypothetical protein
MNYLALKTPALKRAVDSSTKLGDLLGWPAPDRMNSGRAGDACR